MTLQQEKEGTAMSFLKNWRKPRKLLGGEGIFIVFENKGVTL